MAAFSARLLRRRNGKNVAGGEGNEEGDMGQGRASYFGLMRRVDTAALFYGLLKRSSDKFSAAPARPEMSDPIPDILFLPRFASARTPLILADAKKCW